MLKVHSAGKDRGKEDACSRPLADSGAAWNVKQGKGRGSGTWLTLGFLTIFYLRYYSYLIISD